MTIDTIDPEEGQEFWQQVEDHQLQMLAAELRIQKFRETLNEMMEHEAKADAALRAGIQECLRAIDKAREELRREWP